MYIETEAKLRVNSLEQIEHELADVGAEFIQQQLHTDSYFDVADRTLTESDSCLRLRRQLVDGNERFSLTFKGPKEKDEFKKRREVEIEIQDGQSAEKLLLLLGYNKILVFDKKRQLWRFNGCEIALDELPLLGFFVEIEGPDSKKIADVQGSLDLSDLPHISESYASLMEEKLQQLGKKEREIFLKA